MATVPYLIRGYKRFRDQYTKQGIFWSQKTIQRPPYMVVACCDSRVDPALLFQCKPGDLFVLRNIANLIPPYKHQGVHRGTSAALEFGICYLEVQHLILLGHSECAGIATFLQSEPLEQDDFISHWLNVISIKKKPIDVNTCAKMALFDSYQNCLTFPWLKRRLEQNKLNIHAWFLDIETGIISAYQDGKFSLLETGLE